MASRENNRNSDSEAQNDWCVLRPAAFQPVLQAHANCTFQFSGAGHIIREIADANCFHLDSSIASCLLPIAVRR
jgi:hypothetical protein